MIWHVKKEGENRDETGLCQRGHDSLICGRLLPFSPRMLSPSPWIISITPFLWRLPAAPSICSAPGWETVLSLALPRLYFTRFVPGVKFQMWKSKATTLKLQKQQQIWCLIKISCRKRFIYQASFMKLQNNHGLCWPQYVSVNYWLKPSQFDFCKTNKFRTALGWCQI